MIYKLLTINNEDYKLRLDLKGSIELQKKIGKNPLSALQQMAASLDGDEPNLDGIDFEFMVLFTHQALQPYNHGFTIDKTYELLDNYVKDGHSVYDIFSLLIEVLEASGYLPKDKDKDKAEEEGKN